MRSRRDRRARREGLLADSAQVGLLGYPKPETDAEALGLALITLHGVRAYTRRTLRAIAGLEPHERAEEYRACLETVESHCRNVLASMAAFDPEETP